jgi:DNA (cytosine-5)-methyltransferase 1
MPSLITEPPPRTALMKRNRQHELDLRLNGDEGLEVDELFTADWKLSIAVPVISLFSGAGFMDLGFEKVGFKTVYRNEFDPVFAAASNYAWDRLGNRAHVQVHQKSIIDVGPKDLLRRAFGSAGAPSVFGIVGGPPCPDFSVGGKNRGGEGDRGKLTEVFVERILELSPSFFVLENVKGLISTRKHRAFLDALKGRLEKQYFVHERVLNAIDFGVPQDRERVFVIGFSRRLHARKKLASGLKRPYRWPRSTRYSESKSLYDWPKSAPFGSDLEIPPGIPRELTVWGAFGTDDLRALPNGQDMFLPRSDKFSLIREGDDRRKSFKRLHRWRYSPTVAYGNNEVHLHPTEPRRISVREALRLQTVPDDFAFPARIPLSAKFKMVGNGVPVRMAQAVAFSVAVFLDDTIDD